MSDKTKDPNAQGAQQGEGVAEEALEGTTTGQESGDGATTAQEGEGQSSKTFTQAELDAIVNSRVARAVKSAKKEALDAARQQQERQNMDEAERKAAELADAEKRIEELQQRVRDSRIREQLAGRVVNLDDAVRVLSDEFINDDDQTVDVDAFLESRPYFRAQQQERQGGHAKPGSPPATRRLTREQIANMTEKEIEDRWEEVEAVLGGARS